MSISVPTNLRLLDAYREDDNKAPDGKVLDSKHVTLHSREVDRYLHHVGINNLEDFRGQFKLANAIELLQQKNTAGEKKMFEALTSAKKDLLDLGHPDLFEGPEEDAVLTRIDVEFGPPKFPETPQQAEKISKIKHAYFVYQTIRDLCMRPFQVMQVMHARRDAEKGKINIAKKGITMDGIADTVREQWSDNLTSGQKAGLALAVLAVTAFLVRKTDDPEKRGRNNAIASHLVAMGFVGLAAYGTNVAVQLGSGKSAVDWISGAFDEKDIKAETWMKAFQVEKKEEIDALHKGVVFLGDKDFSDYADKYVEARNNGSHRIEDPTVGDKNLTPEARYNFMDTIATRYKPHTLESLRAQFGNLKDPRASIGEVIAVTLRENGHITFGVPLSQKVKGALDQAWNYTKGGSDRAWNSVKSGEFNKGAENLGRGIGRATVAIGGAAGTVVREGLTGLGVGGGMLTKGIVKGGTRGSIGGQKHIVESVQESFHDITNLDAWKYYSELYTQSHGGENASEAEVKDWLKKTFAYEIANRDELDRVIRENNQDRKHAKGFIEAASTRAEKDPTHPDIQFYEENDPNGSIYIHSTETLPEVPKDAKKPNLDPYFEKAINKAIQYLEERYPELKGKDMRSFIDIERGVYVLNKHEVIVHVRFGKGKEKQLRALGLWFPSKEKRRGVVEFKPTDTLEWDKGIFSDKTHQNEFLLRFGVTSDQLREIQWICNFLTRSLRKTSSGAPIDKVMKEIFENDQLQQNVLEAMQNANAHLEENEKLKPRLLDDVTKLMLERAREELAEVEHEQIKMLDVKNSLTVFGYEILAGDKAAKQKLQLAMRKEYGNRILLARCGDPEAIKFWSTRVSGPNPIDPHAMNMEYSKIIGFEVSKLNNSTALPEVVKPKKAPELEPENKGKTVEPVPPATTVDDPTPE